MLNVASMGGWDTFVLWLMPPAGVGGPRGLLLPRMFELILPPVPLLEVLHSFSALPLDGVVDGEDDLMWPSNVAPERWSEVWPSPVSPLLLLGCFGKPLLGVGSCCTTLLPADRLLDLSGVGAHCTTSF